MSPSATAAMDWLLWLAVFLFVLGNAMAVIGCFQLIFKRREHGKPGAFGGDGVGDDGDLRDRGGDPRHLRGNPGILRDPAALRKIPHETEKKPKRKF